MNKVRAELGVSFWADMERSLHMQAGAPSAHSKLQTMFIPVVLRMILGLVWNQFHEKTAHILWSAADGRLLKNSVGTPLFLIHIRGKLF